MKVQKGQSNKMVSRKRTKTLFCTPLFPAKLPKLSIKGQKQNSEMTCTKWHMYLRQNILKIWYGGRIGKQSSKSTNWSHMTSPPRGVYEGKSTLYCHTAWHQHLNAGTEWNILQLGRLIRVKENIKYILSKISSNKKQKL